MEWGGLVNRIEENVDVGKEHRRFLRYFRSSIVRSSSASSSSSARCRVMLTLGLICMGTVFNRYRRFLWPPGRPFRSVSLMACWKPIFFVCISSFSRSAMSESIVTVVLTQSS